ncbi:hypothetical protein PBCVMA1D_746R [Paramecium bursaria Chlorella virus MA1D]|nr:hypothetical protein PBCVMA1D_746R [Paramecium bursaria Chlorella virus MA1D]
MTFPALVPTSVFVFPEVIKGAHLYPTSVLSKDAEVIVLPL